jgi:hypothetical protein
MIIQDFRAVVPRKEMGRHFPEMLIFAGFSIRPERLCTGLCSGDKPLDVASYSKVTRYFSTGNCCEALQWRFR